MPRYTYYTNIVSPLSPLYIHRFLYQYMKKTTQRIRIGADARKRLDKFKQENETDAQALDRLTRLLELKRDQQNKAIGAALWTKARASVKTALDALDAEKKVE